MCARDEKTVDEEKQCVIQTWPDDREHHCRYWSKVRVESLLDEHNKDQPDDQVGIIALHGSNGRSCVSRGYKDGGGWKTMSG